MLHVKVYSILYNICYMLYTANAYNMKNCSKNMSKSLPLVLWLQLCIGVKVRPLLPSDQQQ